MCYLRIIITENSNNNKNNKGSTVTTTTTDDCNGTSDDGGFPLSYLHLSLVVEVKDGFDVFGHDHSGTRELLGRKEKKEKIEK